MGLTVSYRLALPEGRSPLEVLERIRRLALDLPVGGVTEMQHFAGAQCDIDVVGPADPWHWPLITALGVPVEVPPPDVRSYFFDTDTLRGHMVPAVEMHVFSVDPGAECGSALFGLARYAVPVTELYSGQGDPPPVTPAGGWAWRGFCKTQYASNVSEAHFLRCHLSLIALLERAREVGCLTRAGDDGRFWESRDVPRLLRELRQMNAFVAAGVMALGSIPGLKPVGQAPVERHPDWGAMPGAAAYAQQVGALPEILRRLIGRDAEERPQ